MNGLGAARGIGLRGNLGRWTVESEIWVLSLLFISKIFCLFPLFPPVLASPRLKYLSNSRHSQFTLIPSTDGYTDHVNSRVASYIIHDVWAQNYVGPRDSGRVGWWRVSICLARHVTRAATWEMGDARIQLFDLIGRQSGVGAGPACWLLVLPTVWPTCLWVEISFLSVSGRTVHLNLRPSIMWCHGLKFYMLFEANLYLEMKNFSKKIFGDEAKA